MIPLILAAAVCIDHVHDGDTLTPCTGEKIRVANIDAPELPGSPRCNRRNLRGGANPSWCDFDLGYRSRDALISFVASGSLVINREGVDRFGRTLTTLSVNGRDAGWYLVGQGLARWWRR